MHNVDILFIIIFFTYKRTNSFSTAHFSPYNTFVKTILFLTIIPDFRPLLKTLQIWAY